MSRSIAERAGEDFRAQTDGSTDVVLSPRKVGECLKSLRTEGWARLKPENFVLSGEDYLQVWK